MHDGVDVNGAAAVVPGKDRLKLSHTIGVSLLDAAAPSPVQVGLVGLPIAIALDCDARVDSSGIGMPDLKVSVLHGLASVDVDNLEVHHYGNAFQILGNIAADVFIRQRLFKEVSPWLSLCSSWELF